MADRSDIEEVLRRVDLVSVVERHVTLKRSGRGLVGLCPFHQEKTPSFHVNPELGRWHCFGQCAEGGDVLKFIQKLENLSFPEALERLALQAGVTLAPRGRTEGPSPDRSVGDERERIYRINALALRYFQKRLAQTPPAQRYLEERGIAQEAIQVFSLGYAPDVWDGLTQFFVQQGVAMEDVERAGLVSLSERRTYFDKMRGRLIFPIFDVQERPIAFGGRLLGEAGPGAPKYWNSPETPVFSKSRTLYGLGRARKAIAAKGVAVVVEGYTDVVAAHQAGFENVVATLGTSLTEEHVKILSRLAPTVLLAFDADSAGLKAAFRAAAIFEAQEVEVRVLDLPEGEDPDSLLRTGRRRDFQRALETAMPLTEYRLEQLIRGADTNTDGGRLALFRKALPILAAVPSVIEREQYVKRLAPYHPQYRSGAVYAEDQIRQDVVAQQSGRDSGYSRPSQSPATIAPIMVPISGAAACAEHQLLRALAGDDALLSERVLTGLTPEQFWTDEGCRLAEHLYTAYAADFDPDMRQVLADLESKNDVLANALSALLLNSDNAPLTMEVIDDSIAHLEKREQSLELSRLETLIHAGTASAFEMQEYVRRQQEIRRYKERQMTSQAA
jgi:DNA primase